MYLWNTCKLITIYLIFMFISIILYNKYISVYFAPNNLYLVYMHAEYLLIMMIWIDVYLINFEISKNIFYSIVK